MSDWDLPRRERSAQGGKSWEALEGYDSRREVDQLVVAYCEGVITDERLTDHCDRLLADDETSDTATQQ